MSEANETEFLLTASGIVRRRRRVIEETIGDASAILAEAASSVPVDLRGIFASPHKTQVHMRVTRQKLTLFCVLHHLVLNTIWRPFGEGSKRVYPYGVKENATDYGATYTWARPGIERSKPETPPQDGDMFPFFIATADKQGPRWVAGPVYLVATRKGDKKFYRLPLNNTHEDGQICMGSGYAWTAPTLVENFTEALTRLETSPWNTDLRDNSKTTATQAMFAFDLKGKQKGPEGDWTAHCQPVNNNSYSDLPGLIIP